MKGVRKDTKLDGKVEEFVIKILVDGRENMVKIHCTKFSMHS